MSIWINLELSLLLISSNHFMTTLVFYCWYFNFNFSSSDEFVFSIIFLLIFPISLLPGFKVDRLVWIKNYLYDPLVLCMLGISLDSLFCHQFYFVWYSFCFHTDGLFRLTGTFLYLTVTFSLSSFWLSLVLILWMLLVLSTKTTIPGHCLILAVSVLSSAWNWSLLLLNSTIFTMLDKSYLNYSNSLHHWEMSLKLKQIYRQNNFVIFLQNKTFWVCLSRSGLNDIS